MCCTIRDDLVDAVARVLARPEVPEHVVLEASGVADPAGIAVTFLDSVHRTQLRIEVCIRIHPRLGGGRAEGNTIRRGTDGSDGALQPASGGGPG